MLALIQRVSHASVKVNDKVVGEIGQGILAFIGIEKTDTLPLGERLIEKMLSYRIFEDENQKTNLNVRDIKGGLLLVSQFTLVADTQSGTRPGFSLGMPPTESKPLFENLVQFAQLAHPDVASGLFGEYMDVDLRNTGPSTFLLKA